METEIKRVKSLDRPIEIAVTHNGHQWSTIGLRDEDDLIQLWVTIRRFLDKWSDENWGGKIPK